MTVIKLNQLNQSVVFKEYELTQNREIKLWVKIDETNKESEKAGKSILQMVKLLSQAKNLVKNKNWVELTDSGALVVPGRVERDLASAYDKWLVKVPSQKLL